MLTYDKQTKSYVVDNSRQADVAWCAGFFEGEGSVTVYHTQVGFLGNVSCEQKVKEPLLKMQEVFGGEIEPRHSRKSWQWTLYGHQAKAFLNVLKFFIQTPHRQKEIIIFNAYFSTTDVEQRIKMLTWWRTRRAAAETERHDPSIGEATVRTNEQSLEEHNSVR